MLSPFTSQDLRRLIGSSAADELLQAVQDLGGAAESEVS